METMILPPRTGLEAFELLPEGTLCQLINDAIIMSPAPNTPHAIIQSRIFTNVYSHVEKNNLGVVFFAPVDVYLNAKNVYQPDIFFIKKEKAGIILERGIYGSPDLIIEILSSDRKYDLVVKKEIYEVSGVKEYWVVDPITKWCEGFVLQNGQYVSLAERFGQLTISMFDLPITF
jgi:Uma2 family endonuclease